SKSNGIFHQIISVINPQSPPTIDEVRANEFWDRPTTSEIAQIQTDEETYTTRQVASLMVRLKPFTPFTLSVSHLTPLHKDISSEIEWAGIYDGNEEERVFIPEMYGHIIQGKSLASQIDTTA